MGLVLPPEVEARVLALADPPPAGSWFTEPRPQLPPHARGWYRLVVWVPHLPRSEANAGGRLRDKIARKTAAHDATRRELPPIPLPWPRPIRVRLTRVGGKKLDPDNLARSFKAVQDELSTWLGVDDGDAAAVRWTYKQRPGYAAGVEIAIGGTQC